MFRASGVFVGHKAAGDLLFTVLPPILLSTILYSLQHADKTIRPDVSVSAREATHQCSDVSFEQDTCDFVKHHCPDYDNDGLIPYLRLFYCAPSGLQPFVLVVMFLWLAVLFAGMATAAGDFLSTDLEMIVSTLHISESLAGVTIFAFGNGSSDLFSTLAAMKANSGGLAINELFGAAAFITTVVLASVIYVHPLDLDTKAFVKDVVWFTIAASSLVAFLADGQLVLGECLGIIALYAVFVCHSLLQPRNDRETVTVTGPVDRAPGETTGLLNDATTNDTDSVSEVASQEVTSQALNAPESTYMKSIMPAMFPGIHSWGQQTLGEKIVTVFGAPFLLCIGLTTVTRRPQATREHSSDTMLEKVPLFIQLMLGPQFLGIVLTHQMDLPTQFLRFVCPAIFVFSVACVAVNYHKGQSKACDILNATAGFAVALVWIYLTATSAVSLLKTLGLILRLSDAILGATIFAIGNSSNDLVANPAVARRGLPMLAVSACFGGPMMNMLLGIGIGALTQIVASKDTGSVYVFTVEPVMFLSAGILISGLMMTLAYAFWKQWRLDRPIAVALVSLWTLGTICSVFVAIHSGA